MCVSEFNCLSSALSRNVLIESSIWSLFEVGVVNIRIHIVACHKKEGSIMITIMVQFEDEKVQNKTNNVIHTNKTYTHTKHKNNSIDA